MKHLKATNEQILAAYGKHGTLKLAAKELGMCAQSVHERMQKMGAPCPIKFKRWTPEEDEIIRSEYNGLANSGRLKELASRLGRDYTTLASRAGELGVSNQKRPKLFLRNLVDEDAARKMFDRFKSNRMGLLQFCKKVNVSDDCFRTYIRDRWPDEWEAVIESKHPKTSMYRLGRQFEYRVRDIFRAAGYFVLRSPASKSEVDLIAVKTGRVCFIQCKRSGVITSKVWTSFFNLSRSVGAVPILGEMNGMRGTLLWEMTGPKDGIKRAQPRIEFAP